MVAKLTTPKAKAQARLTHYDAFWPYYLNEHSKPGTRAIHFLGTSLALLALAVFFVSGDGLWLALAPFMGYGPAWVAHVFVEKNRPATFRYPLWSLVSDFRMYVLWLRGGLSKAMKRAQNSSAMPDA